MTSSHHGARPSADRLSAETYYALLGALTLIKAQAQLVERWVHRVPVADGDGDAVLRRLAMIERMVERMVRELDAMPAAPAEDNPDAATTNGSGPV